jgi:acyl carrier protein
MDRAALRQALTAMLEEERGESYANLKESTRLREDLGLDSVDLVSLVLRIQERFRVVLTSQDLETVGQVGELLNLLEAKLAAGRLAA